MSIESVMSSSYPILCCPLLLLPPIPPSTGVFSNESILPMRWPKYWSFIKLGSLSFTICFFTMASKAMSGVKSPVLGHAEGGTR